MLDWILGARQTETERTRGSFTFLPMKSTTGIDVTEQSALTYGAVFGAVKAISETVSMLPWREYIENGDRREIQAGSALDLILHRQPNPEMTAFSWREYMVQCALLWGNGYSEIERNRSGEVIGLWPIHPSRVTPKVDNQGVFYYEVSNERGGSADIMPANMYHVKGPTMDGRVGWSVIALARNSWGIGIASDQFAGSFLGNGGTPSLVIHQDETAPDLDEEGAKNMLDSFDRRHKGVRNVGKTAYLERGFRIEPVGIPQKDAQFIEQRKFSVVEVARWFRIPPHKIQSMDNATFSNIESQSIEYVTDAIQPWVERMEQEADMKLVLQPDRMTKMNVNALLRADSAARSQFYREMWNIGVYSINDIRRMEDENPVQNGDLRFVQLNMTTLDRAANQGSTEPASAMRQVVVDAQERMDTKETRAAERAHSKSEDVAEWAGTFFAAHERQLAEAMGSAAAAIGQMYDVPDADVAKCVVRHAERCAQESLRGSIDAGWRPNSQRRADALIRDIVARQKIARGEGQS